MPSSLTRCVYIIGPQSTGKSTLVDGLIERFNGHVRVIKEIARKVMNDKGYTREDVNSGDRKRQFSFQNDIFLTQLEEEARLHDTVYISDRSAIDPLVYLYHYSGENAARRITSGEHWKTCCTRYANAEKSLIVLLFPVEMFLVDDNIRYVADSVDEWMAFAATFVRFLEDQGIPFTSIGEDLIGLNERVELVLNQLSHGDIEK